MLRGERSYEKKIVVTCAGTSDIIRTRCRMQNIKRLRNAGREAILTRSGGTQKLVDRKLPTLGIKRNKRTTENTLSPTSTIKSAVVLTAHCHAQALLSALATYIRKIPLMGICIRMCNAIAT